MAGSSTFASLKSYAHAIILTRTSSFTSLRGIFVFMYRFFAYRVSLFWIQLLYFLSLAFLGSLLLMLLKPSNPNYNPRYVDMLFMSTSALTVSGLGTVAMELLSSSQIVVLTLLMLCGGDVFVSLLGLFFRRIKPSKQEAIVNRVDSLDSINRENDIESVFEIEGSDISITDNKDLKYNCVRYLGNVVLGYSLLFHVGGTIVILVYIALVRSAKDVLKRKGINVFLFSISVTVSSFANAGFIPTNENMLVFMENSTILLTIVVLVLAGNTMFPVFLRWAIWGLSKLFKRAEFDHMMKNAKEIGFSSFLPGFKTAMLGLTVAGFVVIQVGLLCFMNWNYPVFDGLNSYQKLVNSLFMAANSRHAGENSIDLSQVAPTVLTLYIVMMYLPSSTSFTPYEEIDARSEKKDKEKKRRSLLQVPNLILSQLPCIIIFIMAITITERRRMFKDPVNFNVFNIVFETISAYGNVGLSVGYSCAKQINPDGSCIDQPYSFSGWWSDGGKMLLALVMLYGRLKKFTMENGKAWKTK